MDKIDKFHKVILQSTLFRDITLAQLPQILHNTKPELKHFDAGNRIWQAGEVAAYFGLVCQGQVQVLKENQRGNKMIVALIEPTDIFGEAYAYAAAGRLPVSVDAMTETVVLFFEPNTLLTLTDVPGGKQLIRNSLQILAQKSLMLNRKIEVLSQRTITDKVLAYLHLEYTKQKTKHLCIPFNRQEMADFLGVERSALSTTLGNMQKDGLIDYHKNEFTLLN